MMRITSHIYLAALFLLALAGHTYFFHLTEYIALSGFSALEMIVTGMAPEHFTHDFPNGNVAGSSRALLGMAYLPLHQLTGLSGITLLTFMTGLEIACVIGGAWILWSTLVPNEQRDIRLGLFCWLVTMLVAGYVIRPNLSNFGYPFFHGQFYGFADAISMVVIAAFIRRRWAIVAAMLCLGFMVHPIKTLMTTAFIGGAALVGGRETITWKSVVAGMIAASFAGVWGYFWLGLGQPGGIPPIPHDAYIAYTRAWQYHWYPFDRGLFSDNQYNGLSPFLAVMVMGALALLKSPLSSSLRKQWLGGMAVLALLTCIGLWFSYALSSTFMVKLALIRASEMMVSFTPFILVAAIYQQWREERWGWVVLFSGFLLAGMSKVIGLSVVVAAIAVGFYLHSERKQRVLKFPDMLFLSAAVGAAAASILIGLIYPSGSILTPVLSCLSFLFITWLAFSPRITGVVTRYITLSPQFISWSVISALFFCMAAYYLAKTYGMDNAKLAKARDFYAVQRWAKDHTAPDAMFMVDPCYPYAWREFSERSAIGTPFNWYHTGWLYVSDNRVFERGQAIGKTLGLDFKDKLPKPNERAALINYDVCAMAQELFYDPSLAPITRMANGHGVDYFVMENQRSDAVLKANGLTPVFANSHYRVFAAKDLP
jgi:hypothetical protein